MTLILVGLAVRAATMAHCYPEYGLIIDALFFLSFKLDRVTVVEGTTTMLASSLVFAMEYTESVLMRRTRVTAACALLVLILIVLACC